MKIGDSVIMVTSGPASEGFAKLARIESFDHGRLIVEGLLFSAIGSWAIDEKTDLRHRIEADTPERRNYWRL